VYFSFTLLNLNFVLFRYDCGMFVLKNADCLGQDLDPAAGHYYAQKDMPNVRRVALLELIRLKIISGTATATLPASIDPKDDGDKIVETKESDSQPSTIENGAPSSESPSKRRKPNGAQQLESEGDTTATLPPSIDPNLCDKGSGESKADTDNGQPSSKDANNDEKTEEAVVTVAPKEDDEEDPDDDDIQPLSKRRKPNDANKDAEDTEDEDVKPEDEDDNKDDDEDAGEADTVWGKENEDEKTDRIVWKLEWLDFILKIENIEPITLGDLLSLLYKPTRDAISCMVDICCRDWVLPLNSNSFFVADGEDITGASINKFIECKDDEGNPVSNAVYIGE